MDKGVVKVIKVLRKDGWQVDLEKNKHYKVTLIKGNYKAPCISFAATPSDRNAVRAFIRDLRRVIKAGGFCTKKINESY